MLPGDRAKASLKRKGWSYRRAALALEVSFSHLTKFLLNERSSEVLEARINDLPKSPVKYRATGFALPAGRRAGGSQAGRLRHPEKRRAA